MTVHDRTRHPQVLQVNPSKKTHFPVTTTFGTELGWTSLGILTSKRHSKVTRSTVVRLTLRS